MFLRISRLVHLKALYLSLPNEKTCDVVSKHRATAFSEYNRVLQKKRMCDHYMSLIPQLQELFPNLFQRNEKNRFTAACQRFGVRVMKADESIRPSSLRKLKEMDLKWVSDQTSRGDSGDIRSRLDSLYSNLTNKPTYDPFVSGQGIFIHHDMENNSYLYSGDFQNPLASELFDADGNVVNDVHGSRF